MPVKPSNVEAAYSTAKELVDGELARVLSDAKDVLHNLGNGK